MKKSILRFGAIGLVVLLTSFMAPPPVIFNEEWEEPIDGTIVNPCTGEEIAITGVQYFRMHGVMLNNRMNFFFHSTANFTGVGSLGNNYSATHFQNLHGNHSMVNGQASIVSPGQTNYITQGNASNFKERFKFKIIVNANGTVLMDMFDFTAICQ